MPGEESRTPSRADAARAWHRHGAAVGSRRRGLARPRGPRQRGTRKQRSDPRRRHAEQGHGQSGGQENRHEERAHARRRERAANTPSLRRTHAGPSVGSAPGRDRHWGLPGSSPSRVPARRWEYLTTTVFVLFCPQARPGRPEHRATPCRRARLNGVDGAMAGDPVPRIDRLRPTRTATILQQSSIGVIRHPVPSREVDSIFPAWST